MWNPITFKMLLGGASIVGYCICKGDRNEQKRKQVRQDNGQKEISGKRIRAPHRQDTADRESW